MQLWHFTADAPRTPARVSPGDRVILTVGTWPMVRRVAESFLRPC
jgi:hypothetical protein